jgi:hypothetical protein
MTALRICAVLAALVLAGCGGSSPAQKSRAAPPVFLGVTSGAIFSPGASLARELTLMGRSGVQSVRVPFYWRVAQPKPGGPTSFAATDPLVEGAARAGVGVLPVVLGTPAWAARDPGRRASPPRGTDTFAAFLKLLVGRYGSRGSFWAQHPGVPRHPIREWQIWNEPNHTFYWSDQPFARDYVALLRAAGRTVHVADPGARIVLAGFPERSWELIAGLYRAGARGAFDVAAIHPYTFEVGNVLKIVRLVRAAMARAGDGAVPIFVTEFGWSSGAGKVRRPYGFETTSADQAARLQSAVAAFARERRALGIERIYWESWLTFDRNRDNPFDFAGLRELQPDGTVRDKPAFTAYRRSALALARCLRADPSAPCG